MITYEYPFNERIRTLLRLEDLYERYDFFLQQDHPMQHHIALLTLFEMLDVVTRGDVKTDILQELERQKNLLIAKSKESLDDTDIKELLAEIDTVSQSLSKMYGKPGQNIRENEWLMALRGRTVIPGGACEFDLPSYHAWRHLSSQQRRNDIVNWFSSLQVMITALLLALRLLRKDGTSIDVTTSKGLYQKMLQGKTCHLLRLKVDPEEHVIPDVSVNKYMVIIRFNEFSQKARSCAVDREISCKCILY